MNPAPLVVGLTPQSPAQPPHLLSSTLLTISRAWGKTPHLSA